MNHNAARSSITGGKHILGLDLVRFTAAFVVMFFHLAFWSWWDGFSGPGTIQLLFPELPQYRSFASIAWFGWVGVEVFFVISGFVIAMSASGRTWRSFAFARLMRIYPTALISTVVIFPIYFIFSDTTIVQKLIRLLNTLIISPLPGWLDGVFWTLVVELVFYGFVTVALAVKGVRALLGVAWAMALASAVFLSLVALDLVLFSWQATLLLLQHGALFSFGIALNFLIYSDDDYALRHFCLLVVSFCFSLCEVWLTATSKIQAFSFEASPSTPMIVWVICVVLIFSSVRFSDFLNSALSSQRHAIRALGLMTYPLYLVHSLLGGAVLFTMSSIAMNKYVALALAIILCLTVSWAISKAEPLLRVKLLKFKILKK